MTSTRTMLAAAAALALTAGLAAAPAEAKGWKHHHGGGYVAAGLIGGLALGALAASAATAPAYGSAPAYGYAPVVYAPACYKVNQPVTDIYGNVVGYQRVRVCN